MSINEIEYRISMEDLQRALEALSPRASLLISAEQILLLMGPDRMDRGYPDVLLSDSESIAKTLDDAMKQYYEEE
jgi:hypothetical protein